MTATGAVSTATDPNAPQLPADLVERLRAALKRLNPEGAKIGLAVSGGPDSMAMLLLAHAAIPGQFEVATVNHGLRPEAADECALVVAACEARGIACEVLNVTLAEGNLQEQAREARYAALSDWAARRGLFAIATAHHADDQAETFLMRLNRGSGVAGLAGVRETNLTQNGRLLCIRPLLGFRKLELAGVIQAAGIDVAQDPSNVDDRFDRVRIRKALASADWLDPLAVTRSALHLAEANEALDLIADQFWDRDASRDAEIIRLRPHAARAIRLKMMERAICELGGKPRGGDLAQLDNNLEPGKRANLAGVLVEMKKEQAGLFLIFSPEPPRKSG